MAVAHQKTEQIKQKSIKQTTHRTKQQQQIQQQHQIVEESVIKHITASHSKQGEDILDEEAVEDFDVIAPVMHKQLPTVRTAESLEATVEQSTAYIAPDQPEKGTANMAVLQKTAVITQETEASEREERTDFEVKRHEKRVSVNAMSHINQSVSVAEVNVTEESVDIGQSTSLRQEPISLLSEPNQSVIVSQTESSDYVDEIEHAETTKKHVTVGYTVHSSKIVSETNISQFESELEHKKPIEPETAIETTGNVEGLEITEIHHGEVEEHLDTTSKKPRTVNAELSLPESQPLEITEVVTENTSDKFYPELVVATEVATKLVVEQKPYVRQELYVTEKEGVLQLSKSPLQQTADVSLQTKNTASVSETSVEENEKHLETKRLPATATATDAMTTLEGVSIQEVQAQSPTTQLETPSFTTKSATVGLDEHQPLISNIVQISESEQEFEEFDRELGAQADYNYLLLESSEETQTFINEGESNLEDFNVPRGSKAKQMVDQSEALLVDDSYILDSSTPLNHAKAEHSTSAVLAFELQQSKEVSSVMSHEKETNLVNKNNVEEFAASTAYNVHRSLEVSTQEAVQSEQSLDSTEASSVHYAKNVLGQPHISAEVEETTTSLMVGNVIPIKTPSTTAHVHLDEQKNTILSSDTIPLEAITELGVTPKPTEHIASHVVNEQISVQVTALQASENELELVISDVQTTKTADAVHSGINHSLIVEEVEPFSETAKVSDLIIPLTNASVTSEANNETYVSQVNALEAVNDLKIPDLPQANHAQTSVDICRSLQIEKAELSEKEGTFSSVKGLECSIQPNVPTEIHKSIITETTETLQTTADARVEPNQSSQASVVSSINEQTLVVDTVVFEGIDKLKLTEFPVQGIATASQNISNSIQVSTQHMVEQEGSLAIPKQITGVASSTLPDYTLKSVDIAEVFTFQSAGDVLNDTQINASAHPVTSPLDASTVSEIIPYENTQSILSSASPDQFKATPAFDELVCAQTSEEAPAERERSRPEDQPEQQHASSFTSHTLKSVVIEEVELSLSTGDIIAPDVAEKIASVVRLEQQSTAITEVMPIEQLTNINDKITPQQVSAKSTQSELKSVQVLESQVAEKEDMLKPVDHVFHFGTPVQPASFQSVTVEETELSMVPAEFLPEKPRTSQHIANTIQDEHNQTIRSETYVYDDITDLDASKQPSVMTATPSMDTLKSVQILEQQTSDKEQVLHDVSLVDRHMALSKLSDEMKSIIVEEIQLFATTTSEDTVKSPIVSANVCSDELTGTEILEILTLENLGTTKPTEQVSTHIATQILDHHKPLSVQQNDVSEAESTLIPMPFTFELAKESAPDLSHSINIEEPILVLETDDMTFDERPGAKASVVSGHLHETNVSEVLAFENIGDKLVKKLPDQKLGQPMFETHNALVIESHSISEDETNLKRDNLRQDKLAIYVPEHSLVSPVVEEVQEHGTTEDADAFISTNFASVTQTEKDSVTTTETTLFEHVRKLSATKDITDEVAKQIMEENTSVVVSNNETIEMDETFEDKPTFSTHHIQPTNAHALKVVSVNDSEVYSSVRDIENVMPLTKATIHQEPHISTKNSEASVYETISDFKEYKPKESHLVDTDYDTQTEMVTSTVDVFDLEQPLDISLTDYQHVQQSQQTVPLKTVITDEIIPNELSTDFSSEQQQTVHPNIVEALHKQMITTQITCFEQTNQFTESKSQIGAATPTIIPHNSTQQSETQSIDTLKILPLDSLNEIQATCDIDTLQSSVHMLPDVRETLEAIDDIRPEEKVAAAMQSTLEAISVSQVISETNETNLVQETVTKEKARPAVTELIAVQQSNVLPTDSIGPFEDTHKTPINAVPGVSELTVSVKQETQVDELLEDLKEFSQLTASHAKTTLNELPAPVHTKTVIEEIIKPLAKQPHVEEQFIKTTLITSNQTAETFETTINETAETIDYDQGTDSHRRASYVIDSYKSSIIEEVTSTESTAELETTRAIEQSIPTLKQPDAYSTVQVTEVQTAELTNDMMGTITETLDKAKLVESENLVYAKMEKQSMIQGRWYA